MAGSGWLARALGRGRWRQPVGLVLLLAVFALACVPGEERIEILAPDVEIHLGDMVELAPPWQPLYGNFPPAPVWQGDFYVRDARGAYWELTLEVMQANDRANQLFINDVPLNPNVMQAREWDFAAYWVRHHFGVPAGVLRNGRNVLRIAVGQWVPVYQNPANHWEDLQFRNIWLRRVA